MKIAGRSLGAKFLKTFFLTLAIILFANQLFKVRRGATTTAFGWGAPISYANYSTAAGTELRNFLTRHGFESEVHSGSSFDGMHTAHETEEWFNGSFDRSLPFHIRIRTPQVDSSGLCVDVVYYYDDYSWRVNATEKHIQTFTDLLAKWWEDYQQQHPDGAPSLTSR